MTDRTCQKWFEKFHAGEFSLGDAPHSSRPVEVDSDQNKILTESTQHYATQDTAHTLKISKLIKLLVELCILFYRKKHGLFGQPNKSLLFKPLVCGVLL